jgi:hypothetical protein
VLTSLVLLIYGVKETYHLQSFSSLLSLGLGTLSAQTVIFWSLPNSGTVGFLKLQDSLGMDGLRERNIDIFILIPELFGQEMFGLTGSCIGEADGNLRLLGHVYRTVGFSSFRA